MIKLLRRTTAIAFCALATPILADSAAVNVLIVEAMTAWERGQKTSDDSERLEELRDVAATIETLVRDHKSSDTAVAIMLGTSDLPFTRTELRATIDALEAQVNAARMGVYSNTMMVTAALDFEEASQSEPANFDESLRSALQSVDVLKRIEQIAQRSPTDPLGSTLLSIEDATDLVDRRIGDLQAQCMEQYLGTCLLDRWFDAVDDSQRETHEARFAFGSFIHILEASPDFANVLFLLEEELISSTAQFELLVNMMRFQREIGGSVLDHANRGLQMISDDIDMDVSTKVGNLALMSDFLSDGTFEESRLAERLLDLAVDEIQNTDLDFGREHFILFQRYTALALGQKAANQMRLTIESAQDNLGQARYYLPALARDLDGNDQREQALSVFDQYIDLIDGLEDAHTRHVYMRNAVTDKAELMDNWSEVVQLMDRFDFSIEERERIEAQFARGRYNAGQTVIGLRILERIEDREVADGYLKSIVQDLACRKDRSETALRLIDLIHNAQGQSEALRDVARCLATEGETDAARDVRRLILDQQHAAEIDLILSKAFLDTDPVGAMELLQSVVENAKRLPSSYPRSQILNGAAAAFARLGLGDEVSATLALVSYDSSKTYNAMAAMIPGVSHGLSAQAFDLLQENGGMGGDGNELFLAFVNLLHAHEAP